MGEKTSQVKGGVNTKAMRQDPVCNGKEANVTGGHRDKCLEDEVRETMKSNHIEMYKVF